MGVPVGKATVLLNISYFLFYPMSFFLFVLWAGRTIRSLGVKAFVCPAAFQGLFVHG